MALARLRIEGKGPTASGYRLYLDDRDISDFTCAVKLDMSVQDANKATLTVFVKDVEIGADVDPVLLRAKGPERTSFASRFREWVSRG